MLYLQVVGRKIYKYDSYDNVKSSEFKRLSAFRPLPELTVESIPTLEVDEKDRIDLGDSRSKEELSVSVVETLNTGLTGKDMDEVQFESNEELVKSSKTDFVDTNDKLLVNDDVQVREIPRNTLEEKLDEFSSCDNEQVLENNLFEEIELHEVDVKKEGVLEPYQVFLDDVKPCTLKLDLRDIYFGYLGVVDTVKPKEVGKEEPKIVKGAVKTVVQEEKPQTPIQSISQPVGDKFARLPNEDIVMYARRLVRVSEVDVLKYFSPRELESALERGNLLRKRGIIIFAHS